VFGRVGEAIVQNAAGPSSLVPYFGELYARAQKDKTGCRPDAGHLHLVLATRDNQLARARGVGFIVEVFGTKTPAPRPPTSS
jgi:hypothetical protein